MLDKLINYLEKKIGELEIETYNYDTRAYSKAFKKGAEWVLNLIKEFKED